MTSNTTGRSAPPSTETPDVGASAETSTKSSLTPPQFDASEPSPSPRPTNYEDWPEPQMTPQKLAEMREYKERKQREAQAEADHKRLTAWTASPVALADRDVLQSTGRFLNEPLGEDMEWFHQKAALAWIRANPWRSLYLWGDVGGGKTRLLVEHLKNTLAHRTLEQGNYVVRYFQNDLALTDNIKLGFDGGDSYTAEVIRWDWQRRGLRHMLFIADFGHWQDTDWLRPTLFGILDALDANGGQIALASQWSPEALYDKLTAKDDRFGRAAMRRILDVTCKSTFKVERNIYK